MDLTALRLDARDLTNTTSSDFSDTTCDRYLNQYYHKAGEIAMQYGGNWQPFGEIVTINIIEDANNAGYIQKEYLLTDTDVNLRRVLRVLVKLSANDNYAVAPRKDISDLQVDHSLYQPYPSEYDLLEDSLFLFASDYTYTADIAEGIKIYCQTDITELSVTTDIPQLPTVVQDYLSLGAAFKYCVSKGLSEKASFLKNELREKEREIAVFYSNRSQDQIRLMPASHDSRDGEDLY